MAAILSCLLDFGFLIYLYTKDGADSNILAKTVAGGKEWQFVYGFGIV